MRIILRLTSHPGQTQPSQDGIGSAGLSDELLELLWVLEATLAMEPELEQALDRAVAGPCFAAPELPQPKPEERKAPGTVGTAGGLLDMMLDYEDDKESNDDD